MAGSFQERISRLQQLVGSGDLQMKVTFDQVYAVVMERGAWFNYRGWGSPPEGSGPKQIRHMSDGGPHFLRNGLYDSQIPALQRIADHVLDDAEGALIRAAADGAERIAEAASHRAPIEFGDLRESDHPQVYSDGVLVYDRPPAVGRLDTDTLGKKREARKTGDKRRTYLPASSPRHGTVHHHHTGGEPGARPAPTRGETSGEDWGHTLGHWQDRRLPYRFGPRPDRGYFEEEAGSWGGDTDEDWARYGRSLQYGTRPGQKPVPRAEKGPVYPGGWIPTPGWVDEHGYTTGTEASIEQTRIAREAQLAAEQEKRNAGAWVEYVDQHPGHGLKANQPPRWGSGYSWPDEIPDEAFKDWGEW